MRSTNHLRVVVVPFLIALGLLAPAGCQTTRSAGEIRQAAESAYERGEYERSLAEWEEYAVVYPVPRAADLGRGRALLALDRPAEAEPFLERVYLSDPQDEEVLEVYVGALFASRQWDKLTTLLRQRTQQPGRIEDYLRLGRYAQLMDDPDEAERALLSAARIDRGQTREPQFALAEFYHELGDDERALDRYAMALWFDYSDQQIAERIRSLGETPGRTFVQAPAEAVEEGLLAPGAAPPDPRP
ncbi:MAG: hypothetical protein AAFX79_05155 [Planctomycetota bacterium]